MIAAEVVINAAKNANKFPLIVYFQDDNGKMLDFMYVSKSGLNDEMIAAIKAETK